MLSPEYSHEVQEMKVPTQLRAFDLLLVATCFSSCAHCHLPPPPHLFGASGALGQIL